MRETIFSLGTHHGRVNRPCEGDGVCEKTMSSNPCRINTFGQNFHYNIDFPNIPNVDQALIFIPKIPNVDQAGFKPNITNVDQS